MNDDLYSIICLLKLDISGVSCLAFCSHERKFNLLDYLILSDAPYRYEH